MQEKIRDNEIYYAVRQSPGGRCESPDLLVQFEAHWTKEDVLHGKVLLWQEDKTDGPIDPLQLQISDSLSWRSLLLN